MKSWHRRFVRFFLTGIIFAAFATIKVGALEVDPQKIKSPRVVVLISNSLKEIRKDYTDVLAKSVGDDLSSFFFQTLNLYQQAFQLERNQCDFLLDADCSKDLDKIAYKLERSVKALVTSSAVKKNEKEKILEEYLVLIGIFYRGILAGKSASKDLSSGFKSLVNLTYTFVINKVDPNSRSLFAKFYLDFIWPTLMVFPSGQTIDFLKKRVGNFNQNIFDFLHEAHNHAQLHPDLSKKITDRMHRRWNFILKNILKRY